MSGAERVGESIVGSSRDWRLRNRENRNCCGFVTAPYRRYVCPPTAALPFRPTKTALVAQSVALRGESLADLQPWLGVLHVSMKGEVGGQTMTTTPNMADTKLSAPRSGTPHPTSRRKPSQGISPAAAQSAAAPKMTCRSGGLCRFVQVCIGMHVNV